MKRNDSRNSLISHIARLDERASYNLVRERIEAGEDPLEIIEDCQQGLRLVGEKYQQGDYYIAGLIMAGEIFRQVTELLQPLVEREVKEESSGVVLIGTVQGDIHNLGKNIVNMLLKCHGFTVRDLGVDVSPSLFAGELDKIKPDIVGLSGLLTTSYDCMKKTIDLIRKQTAEWPKPPYIIIGGSQINERVSTMVGADYWTNDAVRGVNLIKSLFTE